MIYKNLDTIPYKLFIKITETGDLTLLSDSDVDEETDIELLAKIWEEIYDEHLSKNETTESKKIFKLSKNIDGLLALNKVVMIACESLRFEFNEELLEMILGFGYQLSVVDTESYYSDIERIEREANAYIIKAENYKNMLPDKAEGENSEFSVDDVMALYCTILGFNIGDFNFVSYNAFRSYEKQVNAKIKSMNQNKNTNHGK